MSEHSDINTKLGEISQWQKDHERHDDARFRKIEERLDSLPDRNEIEDIVKRAISDVFVGTAKSTKFVIITLASIIAALTVIGGGLKTVLAWLGFTFMGR